jgi:hypothetical protein
MRGSGSPAPETNADYAAAGEPSQGAKGLRLVTREIAGQCLKVVCMPIVLRVPAGGLFGSCSALAGVFCLFREMPGVAPVAAVGSEFHGGAGGGDLVPGSGEGGAFGGVFALAADRTFGGVVHCKPYGRFLGFAVLQRFPASVACGVGKSNHLPTRPIAQLFAARADTVWLAEMSCKPPICLRYYLGVFLTSMGGQP